MCIRVSRVHDIDGTVATCASETEPTEQAMDELRRAVYGLEPLIRFIPDEASRRSSHSPMTRALAYARVCPSFIGCCPRVRRPCLGTFRHGARRARVGRSTRRA